MASVPAAPLSTTKPAVQTVQSCALSAPVISPVYYGPAVPLSPAARAKLVPCDVKLVTLTFVDEKKTVTLISAGKAASATPIAGLDPEINGLLAAHALVIVQVVPATTVSDRVGVANDQARTGDLTTTKGSAKASASISAQMKAQCGAHPDFKRTPALKGAAAKDTDAKACALAAETQEWTAVNFIKALFGGVKFRDFIFGQKAEVTFQAGSCGFPAAGEPTTALSAFAQLALADEWVGDFVWEKGFKIEFNESVTHGIDYRDKSRMESQSSSVKSSTKSLDASSSQSTVTKQGALIYGNAKSENTFGSVEITYKGKSGSGSIEGDMKRWDSTKLPESIGESFKKKGEGIEKLSSDGTLSVKLVRNGKTIIDSKNLGAALEDAQKTVQTAFDLVNRLVWLLENGAKAGIPVTLTFGLKASVTLLAGRSYARFWAEPTPPRQSGTYYIAGYRRRFQLGVDITPISVSLTPSITFQAKIVHQWIASITLTITGKISGSAKIGYNVTDALSAFDYNAGGKFVTSITGSGEAAFASFYVMVEATASSGITYVWTSGFDGESMKRQTNKVTSRALSVQASARYGNKIWDFIGLGADEPDWQWPADGPFVWLDENAISKNW